MIKVGSVAKVLAALLLFSFSGFLAFAQESETPVPSASVDPVAAAQDFSVPASDLPYLLLPLTADDLTAVAGTWQGHIKSELSELGQLNIKLRKTNGAQEDALRAQVSENTDGITAALENYGVVLDAWASKGGAAEDIQPHRDYATAVARGTLKSTDFQTLLSKAWSWLTSSDGGLKVLLGGMTLLVSIWVLMFIARMARNMARRGLDRVPTLSRLLKSFVVTTVYWSVLVVGVMVVLGLFGVNVTPLFAVFGGLSFILGFALQETLGNLASGLMIMVLKPFDTGDYVQTAGTSGFVDEMSVVSTKVRTFDNQIITVPNSKIWGDVITNVSAAAERRVDLVFGIGYGDSAEHAIRVLNELVGDHHLCLKDPEPEVFVGELGDSSVNIFCRPWVKTDDYWTVYWDLTGQAKERFDAEAISIPFPQRDVHIIQDQSNA